MYIHDQDRENAVVLIRNIAQSVAEWDPKANLNLASGRAGLGLYFSLMHNSFPEAGYALAAQSHIDSVIAACAEGPIADFRFFGGLPGIGYAVETSMRLLRGSGESGDDINEDLDFLVRNILARGWPGHYDLINGLVGVGVFILSRPESEDRQKTFSLLLQCLTQTMTEFDGGVAWETERRFFGYESRNLPVEMRNFNLGVAHGNPGVILLLAWAVAEGVCVKSAAPLLARATKWLLDKAGPGVSSYGYVVDDDKTSRIAWCYGDLGNSLTLIRSGLALDDNHVYARGLALGIKVAERARETAMINDHGLCHGSAGVGLLFSALHRDTNHPVFLAAARDWYRDVVSEGTVDLANLDSLKDDGKRGLEFGLLTGISGIGMALSDALDVRAREWSRWLLI